MVIPVGMRGFQEPMVLDKSGDGHITARTEGVVVFVEFVGR